MSLGGDKFLEQTDTSLQPVVSSSKEVLALFALRAMHELQVCWPARIFVTVCRR